MDELIEPLPAKKKSARTQGSEDRKLLDEARRRFKESESADSEDRKRAKRELEFAWNVDNAQWDEEAKKLRKNRPCLVENRLPSFIRQVINEIRRSRPSGRVLPVDDHGDKYTASVKEGLIRNIEANSRADMAYDTAAEYAAYCGRGYWKIATDYVEDSFDQDIVIRVKKNPFSVFDDPNCQQPDKSDRKYAFETEWMDNDEFEEEFGEKPTSFSEAQASLGNECASWFEETKTLVANYWHVKCSYTNLHQMSDGAVVPDPDAYIAQWQQQNALAYQAAQVQAMAQPDAPMPQMPIQPVVKQTRKQEKRTVEWCTLTGTKVYHRGSFAGQYIPLVYVGGEQVTIESRDHTKGLTADVQDLAKANNYLLSAQMEHIALSPKIPFIGPKGAFKTDNDKWNTANAQSYSYIEYDGAVPPARADQVQVQPEIMNMKAGVVDGMRNVVGLMGASLGDQGPETAWRAIAARQQEGDTAVFHFMDNLVRAVRYSCMVILDLMPHIYDTSRVVRIIGPDTKPMNIAIQQMFNDENGQARFIDFARGKYDVTVSAGPAFETQRQQTAATLVDLSTRNPQLFGAAGDIVVKSLAMPQADELAERIKRTIPPHILGEGPTQQEQQLQQQIQQMQQALSEANVNLAAFQSELAKQAAALASKQVDYQTSTAKLQSEVVQAQLDKEVALLDVQKKEVELAITQAKGAKDMMDANEGMHVERMMSVVQSMMGEQENRVRELVPQIEQKNDGKLDQILAVVAQQNAQLQRAIAGLTEATLRPREQRVIAPGNREFRAISAPVPSSPVEGVQ